MEIEDGEALPPPPPPTAAPGAPGPDAPGPDMGPACPPADYDAAAVYADPAAYEAYLQSSVAYQVSLLLLLHTEQQLTACSGLLPSLEDCT